MQCRLVHTLEASEGVDEAPVNAMVHRGGAPGRIIAVRHYGSVDGAGDASERRIFAAQVRDRELEQADHLSFLKSM